MRSRILILITAAVAACGLSGCGGRSQASACKSGADCRGGHARSAQFVQQARTARFPQKAFAALASAPTLRGYDAVDTRAIPSDAQAVGCYVGPGYYTCTSAHARAPAAKVVTIAQQASVPGKVLDTEPGDAVPSQDPAWVHWMIRRGVYRPAIYASLSQMGSVRYYLSRAGLSRSQYLLWVAAWDDSSTIPTGFDAKQWKSTFALDWDTFGAWFLAPPPPPDARHYDYFVNRTFYNSTRRAWCSKGCNERTVVWRYDYERANAVKYRVALLQDQARLGWLDQRLLYLIQTRSVQVNGTYRVYGREKNVKHREDGGVCTSFAGCND